MLLPCADLCGLPSLPGPLPKQIKVAVKVLLGMGGEQEALSLSNPMLAGLQAVSWVVRLKEHKRVRKGAAPWLARGSKLMPLHLLLAVLRRHLRWPACGTPAVCSSWWAGHVGVPVWLPPAYVASGCMLALLSGQPPSSVSALQFSRGQLPPASQPAHCPCNAAGCVHHPALHRQRVLLTRLADRCAAPSPCCARPCRGPAVGAAAQHCGRGSGWHGVPAQPGAPCGAQGLKESQHPD